LEFGANSRIETLAADDADKMKHQAAIKPSALGAVISSATPSGWRR
jgi:hypothetical protein